MFFIVNICIFLMLEGPKEGLIRQLGYPHYIKSLLTYLADDNERIKLTQRAKSYVISAY